MSKKILSFVTAIALLVSMFTGIAPMSEARAAVADEITSLNPARTTVGIGGTPSLPSVVTAVYASGNTSSVQVSWDTAEVANAMQAAGVYVINGTVDGTSISAVLNLTVKAADSNAPAVWYKMDETSGTTVSDASGNGNNGTMVGGEGWTTGKADGAANLTGSNYIKLPDGVMKNVTDFTITAWECQSKVSAWRRLFDFGTGTSYYMYLTLYDGSNLRFSMNKNSSWQEITTGAVNDVGTWHHIAVSKSGSTATVYVDGVAVATSDTMTYTPADLGTTTQTYIGKSQYSADANFAGQVDDFRIYTRALSMDEIQNIIGETVTDAEAVAINKASLNLGDTFAVESNLTLKNQGTIGVSINWASDDETHVSSTGAVTRPVKGESAVTVHLTATLKKNAVTDTKTFAVTLLPVGAVPYCINVNAAGKGVAINPDLNGIFFEDINYSLDGGLYPELVQNKSFEFVRVGSFTSQKADPLFAWNELGNNGGAKAVNNMNPICENNSDYLSLTLSDATKTEGMYNTGFSNTAGTSPTPSMAIVQNDKYDLSFFARTGNFNGSVEVDLTNEDGSVVYAAKDFTGFTNSWQKYTCEFDPKVTSNTARLQVIAKGGTGTVDIDMVSLFPQRTWKGRTNGVRYDLGKMLSDMKPKYLRFPGGCAVEGGELLNAYNWKYSVGPLEERKSNWNFRFNSTNPDYNQSLGMGFYEFFQFAEDIGATPVPCINAGMAYNGEAADTATGMGEYIQNAIDLIEFANGTDTSNKWVALRKSMGHAEPFNMKYLEIGNENTGSSYYTRYKMVADAIRAAGFTDIKLIIGGGITIGDDFYLTTWSKLRNEAATGIDANVVDEHYYVSNSTFYANMNRYDNYDRDAQHVFIGEYASSSTASSITDALAEASYMTQIEENGDVVELASYAPLLAKDNFTQWTPDMIYFNNQAAYGTPSYYVQKEFMRNTGDYTLPTELAKYGYPSHTVQGSIGLGSYNTAVTYKGVTVTDNGTNEVLFSDDFTGDASKWTASKGTWTINGGAYAQSSPSTINTLAYAGNITSENYTVSFKARKDSGDEGFLVYVGLKDPNNYLRWDIGGFSNTKSGFERCVDGTTTQLVPYYDTAKFPSVKTGTWYDVKLVVSGNKAKCYIKAESDTDYTLAFDIVDRPKTGPVYTIASKEEATGDIIVKVVNPQSTPQQVSLNLSGADYINPVGLKKVLEGSSSSAANSFSSPDNVAPVTTKITGLSSVNDMTFDPYSLTILRIRTSKEDAAELSSVAVSTNSSTAQEGDTVRVNIDSSTMSDNSTADLGDAVVSYECDHPDLVTFDSDGKAAISSAVGDVTSITFWANVTLNGTTVKSNEVTVNLSKTAIASIKDIYVSTTQNTQPAMPSKIYVTDEYGVTKLANVSWASISKAQLSAPGSTFTVEGTVEGTDIKAVAHVSVSDAVVMTGMETVSISTNAGVQPALPSTVTATYSDGSTKDVAVTWDSIPDGELASAGTVKVNGTVQVGSYTNPLIEQRADPYIYRHTDGYYYFMATVPDFDKLVIRKAKTIEGLANAKETTIWTAHSSGTMANHIWAPELHYINGRWYIYFAAGASTDQWEIRPYVLECNGADPTVEANWEEKGMMQAASADTVSFSNFSLDATTFENNGKRYLVWAQKTTEANTPSNLYIAEMQNPWTLKTSKVLISEPEYSWEKKGYYVNEGPSVIKRNGKVFISYSASATDENYCMGLLTASDTSDLLNASSWTKASEPVMKTNEANKQYGPGHNSFTVAEDGVTDILVYHTRDYPGYLDGKNALTDPNRHMRVKMLTWNNDGTPDFGDPLANGPTTAAATVTANVTVNGTSK